MNRRHFLWTATACGGSLRAQSTSAASGTVPPQKFRAGVVPGGAGRGGRGPMGAATTGGPPAAGRDGGASGAAGRGPGRGTIDPAVWKENFWASCDQCATLGVHYIELHPEQVLAAYENNVTEYKDEMAKRKLTMLNFAMYAHWHKRDLLAAMIDTHVRTARFMEATGGKHIVGLIAPGDNLADGTAAEYAAVDAKAVIANVNEIGKRVREETGVLFGFHPEQGGIKVGLDVRVIDGTDPRYFYLWPDIGHYAAVNIDPMTIYRKYLTRMSGTHLRDVAPGAPDVNGRPGAGRMVPFGTGTVPMKELVKYLRENQFAGAVFGEGGGTQAMRDYMVDVLALTM